MMIMQQNMAASIGWVARELSAFTGRQDITSKSFMELVEMSENIMYDRYMCHVIGAEYSRMDATDREKIYRFVVDFKPKSQ
jgi:hypothetical protein